MAVITLNIPDAQLQRVLDALGAAGNYQAIVQDPTFPSDATKQIPNPVSKAAFAKSFIINYIRSTINQIELQAAVSAATTGVAPPPPIT